MQGIIIIEKRWWSMRKLVQHRTPTPVFELREDDENDRMLLIRNKFPKLTIEINDDCDLKQLSDALKAAGEFVFKYRNQYGRS